MSKVDNDGVLEVIGGIRNVARLVSPRSRREVRIVDFTTIIADRTVGRSAHVLLSAVDDAMPATYIIKKYRAESSSAAPAGG
jgi:hypothetical protein